MRRPCKGHFAPVGEGPTNKIGDIGATQLHFNANVALSECLLLVQALQHCPNASCETGIETIPGPTNQERIPNIRAKKQNILSVLSKLKSNPPSQRMIGEVARNLNNLLFEDIFTREKAAHVRNVNQRAALKR